MDRRRNEDIRNLIDHAADRTGINPARLVSIVIAWHLLPKKRKPILPPGLDSIPAG
jgi:hypothetical protein